MSERERDILSELGAQLPWDRPDESRREGVRAALLQAAREEGPPVTSIWTRRRGLLVGGIGLGGALAAAAAIALLVGGHGGVAPRGGSGGPRALATVEAAGSATYERHVEQTETGSDEVVRVREGKLHFAAGVIAPGDHLRVASGDAEVEGQGDFDVVVVADAIDHVTVRSGTARVTPTGQRAVFLAAGQTWHAATITATIDDLPKPAAAAAAAAPAAIAAPVAVAAAAPAPVAAPAPIAAPRLATSREVSPAPRTATRAVDARAPAPVAHTEAVAAPSVPPPGSPAPAAIATAPTEAAIATAPAAPAVLPAAIEQHFQRGTQLLRTGHAAEAATELAAAADASTTEPLAVDARYFEAVALLKANRPGEAERAVLAFLDHAPSSPRRGRASVMLARLLATHDRGSARAWFQAALHDADPSVAAAATAGLGSL